MKAFFSGVWEYRVDGFSIGGEVVTADAAIELDMEDIVEAETAELV